MPTQMALPNIDIVFLAMCFGKETDCMGVGKWREIIVAAARSGKNIIWYKN